MTPFEDIDYEELHLSLVNGNRTDVADVINDSTNPAWTVLRLLREMMRGDEPLDADFVTDVVGLQSLVENRCERREE